MKIEKVSYGGTYSLGNYCSERIDLEASIDKNESPEEAIKILKELCDTIHRNNNPQLEQSIVSVFNEDTIKNQPSVTITSNPQPFKKITPEEGLTQQIKECTTLKFLELFKKPSEKYPEIHKLWLEKKQQLLNTSIITN